MTELAQQIEKINNSLGLESENYESFNIPTAEELNKPIEELDLNEEKPKEENNIEPGNIKSAVDSIRNVTKKIEEASFKIETEEFDFEDLYQIIIKIEKE